MTKDTGQETGQTNGYGDPLIPSAHVETIVFADVHKTSCGHELYIKTDRDRSFTMDVEHKDEREQRLGQDALHRLLRACDMPTIDDSSELIGQKIQWKWSAQDIVEWYAESQHRLVVRVNRKPPQRPTTVREDASKDGRYVYVISCVGSPAPMCKIGIANSAENRLKTLRTSSPHPLRLDFARYTDNARGIESTAHAKFAGRRLNGEWFQMPAAEAITYVNSAIEGSAA